MMMQLNGYKGNDMSLGGGSSSQQQLDPALKDLYLKNYETAQGTASGLQKREFAGLTPEQDTAMQNISQFANPNSEGFNALRNAYGVANTAAQYSPNQVTGTSYGGAAIDPSVLAQAAQLNRSSIQNVSNQGVSGQQVAQEALGAIAPQARANIRDVNAGSFLNQNMQAYMNPYNQAVTQQGLSDLERSRQLEQQNTAAKATAAKAFGGSRQGVAEAETNRAYGETAQKYIGTQNAAAYEAARTAAEADLTRQAKAQELNQAQDAATTKQSLDLAGQFGLANQDAALRASLANQGIDFSTGKLNTETAQQTALANQAAQNLRASQQASLYQQAGLTNADRAQQASLANQQAGLTANQQKISAANQMANAGTSFADMGIKTNQALADQGLIRQGFSQQQLDAIRNLPLEQQQILNQALGINVGGGSGTTSTSTSKQGLLGLLGIG
tara:strand:- start:245 stop:1576 length:1332 start_codon:yes stop_codon:yes gene_type:complete